MISTTMLGDFLILLVFVPYMNILLYMVQILSLLQLNLLIFVPYLQFFLCMVQISSFLHFNLLIFVPYTHFLLRMVQISSFLLFNLLISVPSIHFLAYMVQIQGFHDNYSAYTTTFSLFWQLFVDSLTYPIFTDYISIFYDTKFFVVIAVTDVSFHYKSSHLAFFPF